MRICEARNMRLAQVMEMTEEELILILAHASIEEDVREEKKRRNEKKTGRS